MDIDNNEENEKLLIASFKRGDQEAFTKLYKKYSPALYQYIFFITQNKEQSEGIVQDVFLKVWEGKDRIDENLSFESYIHTIAKNKFYDFIRKSVHREAYLTFLAEKRRLNLNQTELEINYLELVNVINELIAQLPPKRKRIYELNQKNGLTRKEIAEKLCLSVSTVDNQLVKAFKFIRSGLKDLGYFILLLLFFQQF
ncbi:RNA polymerase sigma-70 factor [Candidatus Sulfidibacterium hydrothermale]|uniref:RNA polymerase sigma factor n=1 Tax=Candidatus Sulfidibacterium hydrothermale TaxID=2875962 RepID=UPI001F0B0565|nr:RNA polymerase sigma-70 factor [Candidatus Sulfidibacterium hydrothermale]UBM62669.1 RNA polymerase sigma-70 factor [Candidatus Sulfidibacterium hydrothermale]